MYDEGYTGWKKQVVKLIWCCRC